MVLWFLNEWDSSSDLEPPVTVLYGIGVAKTPWGNGWVVGGCHILPHVVWWIWMNLSWFFLLKSCKTPLSSPWHFHQTNFLCKKQATILFISISCRKTSKPPWSLVSLWLFHPPTWPHENSPWLNLTFPRASGQMVGWKRPTGNTRSLVFTRRWKTTESVEFFWVGKLCGRWNC